jgi:hypothetical protein
MSSNFYKGTPHTGTLAEMEMGSIQQLEFEIELRDRNHGARELVLRPLRRTNWFSLTGGVSILKVHRVRHPKQVRYLQILTALTLCKHLLLWVPRTGQSLLCVVVTLSALQECL